MKKLWVDTETTGLDPERNAIIQIAVIIETPDAEVQWEAKMRPWDGAEVEDGALKVNHSSREEIAAFPDPRAVYAEFTALLGDHVAKFDRADKFWFWGFNSGFDFQFLHSWAKACGDKYLMSWMHWPPLCVAQEIARRFPDRWASFPSRKLGAVACACDVTPPENLHDAMADIVLTRELWRKMCLNQ